MLIKIHDKNQQDGSLGNGTCHQTSQPESNFPNLHGSRKRKLTPVLGRPLISTNTDTHTSAHTNTDTHAQAHVHYVHSQAQSTHTHRGVGRCK